MTTLRIGLLGNTGPDQVPDTAMLASVPHVLTDRGYQVVVIETPEKLLGQLYGDPVDIILVSLHDKVEKIIQVIQEIRNDSYFSMMPVLGLVPASMVAENRMPELPIDDFVIMPLDFSELFSRIALAHQRIRRVLDNNPLTRLPGNTSIQLAIELALEEDMAVCYLDINHFKSYNDTYGFTRGDEVIRMVGRITNNVIKENSEQGFAGHIGGDDFVFIVPLSLAQSISQMIIDHFHHLVSDLFGEHEKKAGFYRAKNRQGEEERIPLLGIAIAIVPTNNAHISHPGKVAEIASELKRLAKKSAHSCYVVDRRVLPRNTL